VIELEGKEVRVGSTRQGEGDRQTDREEAARARARERERETVVVAEEGRRAGKET
jgi:hypothetical protein